MSSGAFGPSKPMSPVLRTRSGRVASMCPAMRSKLKVSLVRRRARCVSDICVRRNSAMDGSFQSPERITRRHRNHDIGSHLLRQNDSEHAIADRKSVMNARVGRLVRVRKRDAVGEVPRSELLGAAGIGGKPQLELAMAAT